MKTVKRNIGTLALVATMILTVSCKDANQKEATTTLDNETQLETTKNSNDMAINDSQESNAEVILKNYFNLKDALVNDDQAEAKDLGMSLSKSLSSFDTSIYSDKEQTELQSITKNAQKHAEEISKNEIASQREHFKVLSKNITDMVAITGTEVRLYEQFCPMYDGGTAWLSTKEEIRNPYFGSQMLKCGKVQREIN